MEIGNTECVSFIINNTSFYGASNNNSKNSYFQVNGFDIKSALSKFVGRYKWCNIELVSILYSGFSTFTTSATGHEKSVYILLDGLPFLNPSNLNVRGRVIGGFTFMNGASQNSGIDVIGNRFTLMTEPFSIENIEVCDLEISLCNIARGVIANPDVSFTNYTLYFNVYPILESAIDITSIPEFNQSTKIIEV